MLAHSSHTLRKLPRRLATLVDRWHWVLLALASPAMLFPSPARSLALLIVPLLWTVAWIARPRAPLPSTPLNVPLLLLMVMVLVSVLVTPDLAFSLSKVAGMVLAFGTFFAVAREAQQPLGFWLSLLLLLAMGAGIAAVGLVGTNWSSKFDFMAPITTHLGTRLTGLTGAEEGFNPDAVAGVLLWVLPVFVCLIIGFALAIKQSEKPFLFPDKLWAKKIIVVIAIMALSVAVLMVSGVFVLTQSRGGYAALVVTFVGIVFVVLPWRWRRILTGILLTGILAVLIFFWQVGPGTIEQQLGLGADTTNSSSDLMNTIEGRVEIWSRALYGIEDFPITGMGMNSFRRVVHLLYPLFLIRPDVDIAHAHNEFLQAALDLGLPGLIAFTTLHVVTLWMLRRIWMASMGDPLTHALVLGLGGGLFAHLVYGMTNVVGLGAKPGVPFWMLLALTCGLFAQYFIRAKEICSSLAPIDVGRTISVASVIEQYRHD